MMKKANFINPNTITFVCCMLFFMRWCYIPRYAGDPFTQHQTRGIIGRHPFLSLYVQLVAKGDENIVLAAGFMLSRPRSVAEDIPLTTGHSCGNKLEKIQYEMKR